MGFTGAKDGSNGFVKRVASSFSNMRKKKTAVEPKGLPRSKSTGANYESMRLPAKKVADLASKSRTKSAGVSPQPRREKIDGQGKEQFGELRCFDDSDSIWLSSNCASPTSFLEEQHRLSVSFHFSVDDRVVSWLSNLANSSPSLNLGANSIKERRRKKLDSSVSRSTKENAENVQREASKEGKISSSDGNSVGKSRANLSLHGPEKNRTRAKKLSEDSSGLNSSVTAPSSSSLDSSSQVTEEKKVSFSLSSGKELESENSSSSSDSMVKPSDSKASSASSLVDDDCLEQGAETVNSKKRNIVEPLFWPFEQIFDWTPEDILKHFSMSPRKKKSLGAKTTTGTSTRTMRQQLHTKKLDFKEGNKRKLVFNGPAPKDSKIPELKRIISNSSSNGNGNSTKSDINKKNRDANKNGMKRNKSLPSRLSNSSKVSSKVVPIEVAEEAAKTDREKSATQKLVARKSRTFIEDDFAFLNDLSIEKVVGLGEFNGREGIDSDSTGEFFFLDDSL